MNTAEEFQARRRKTLYLILSWIAVGLFGAALALIVMQPEAKELVQVLAFGWAIIGAIAGIYIYRCPSCGKVPSDDDGIMINPSVCPSCGAKLK